MSAGPIQRGRDGAKVPDATTSPAKVVHAFVNGRGFNRLSYCGRKVTTITVDWQKVTCSDCLAAHRADNERNHR